MKKTIYIVHSVLVLASVSMKAQVVDQSVTVEREYKPIIQDAGKITSVPEVMEADVEHTTIKYTDFTLPLSIGASIHTLPPAQLKQSKRQAPNGGLVRFGAGNFYNNLFDLILPIVRQPENQLDLTINHLATFGNTKHSQSSANLAFNHLFENSDLFANIGGKHEYFSIYGDNYNKDGYVIDLNNVTTSPAALYDELNYIKLNRTAQTVSLGSILNQPTSDVIWRYYGELGMRSLPGAETHRYLGAVKFKSFNSRNGLNENILHTKAQYSNLNEKNRLGVDVEMLNMFYSAKSNQTPISVWDNYSVLSLNPFYSIERESWNIRLGATTAFSFIYGRGFSPSPDLSAEWKVAPTWLSIYGKIGGQYKVNTMDLMFEENRFLFPDLKVKDTYTPLNTIIGFKLKPSYQLLFDAYYNYQYIDNQYFFINKDYGYNPSSLSALSTPGDEIFYTNEFQATYSSARLSKFGMRANYNIRNLINVQLKGAYNHWTVFQTEMAWNQPKFEADLSAEIAVGRNFTFTTATFFESPRYAKLGNQAVRMKPIVDINLGASYNYKNWLSLFGKINNILNSKYQEYYGYTVQGFNVMTGAAITF